MQIIRILVNNCFLNSKVKRSSFLSILGLSLLLFTSCSTQKPTLDQIVYNSGSMTKSLKSLSNNFSVQILKTGILGPNYVRITALKLNNQAVIAAISQTNLHDEKFVSILANANIHPIGPQLFSPLSSIKRRDTMTITPIILSDINNKIIVDYLTKLGYNDHQTIIERQSQFYYNTQTMDLIEYILPSINQFVNKQSDQD